MTWRLGVVGSPISHSLTPRIHDAALASLGLAGSSEAIEIDRSEVDRLRDVLGSHDALSITMPLKEVAIEQCDVLDEVAQRIGGVNSIVRRDGQLHGRALDGQGFLSAIDDDFDLSPDGCRVVIVGSGGAAKSILDAVVAAGASVTLLARNRDVLNELARRYPSIEINPERCGKVDLIVNTVPATASPTFPTESEQLTFSSGAVAIDIVYAPPESEWLANRRRQGLRTANGLSMLVHQARLQLEWWFERPVALSPLFSAVRA